ncbi:MAG: hypothetical protein LAT84_11315 [Balneolia bacterium]|nr:hypothetical protein [Balneolia bacterium]
MINNLSYVAFLLLIFAVYSCDTVDPYSGEPTLEIVNPVISSNELPEILVNSERAGPVYIQSCGRLLFAIDKLADGNWQNLFAPICNGFFEYTFSRVTNAGESAKISVTSAGLEAGLYRVWFNISEAKTGINPQMIELEFEVVE